MKKVLVVVVLAVVAFCGFVAMRPGEYTVERKATFAAPPQVVYGLVSDFHHWDEWSPWSKLDPNLKPTFGGNASGVGSTYAWSGNDKVGEGKMTITEVKPNEKVAIQLEFIKPFASTNETLFELKPEGTGTELTWKMNGKANFVFKAMSLFKSADAMMGPDFEKGLANLKPIAEAEGKKAEEAAKADEAAKAAAAAAAAAAAPADADGGTGEAAAAPAPGSPPSSAQGAAAPAK